MQTLKELVEKLPLELHEEVRDFVESLLEKKTAKRERKLKLDWRGALRDMREEYTSVELQHKVLDWWAADVPHRHKHSSRTAT